jgi:hypothetical protein
MADNNYDCSANSSIFNQELLMDDFKKAGLKPGVDYTLMDSPTIHLFDNPKAVKHLVRKRARRQLKKLINLVPDGSVVDETTRSYYAYYLSSWY